MPQGHADALVAAGVVWALGCGEHDHRLVLAERADRGITTLLVEVVKLVDLTEGAHIERELMLIKVKATGAQRAEIKRTSDIFRGQIVDVSSSVYTVQLAGTSDKLDAFVEAVGEANILEVVRSGVSGIARGDKTLAL